MVWAPARNLSVGSWSTCFTGSLDLVFAPVSEGGVFLPQAAMRIADKTAQKILIFIPVRKEYVRKIPYFGRIWCHVQQYLSIRHPAKVKSMISIIERNRVGNRRLEQRLKYSPKLFKRLFSGVLATVLGQGQKIFLWRQFIWLSHFVTVATPEMASCPLRGGDSWMQ